MGRFSASASRRDAAWRAAILAGVLLAAPALPAVAQTVVLGGPTGPDVVVNEQVLDALGPPQNLPGLLRQENTEGVAPSGLRPFTLHPPRARAHRTASVSRRKPVAEKRAPRAAVAVLPTAIPLGKPHRTVKAASKSRPVEQASAATGAATPPSPPAATPRSQVAQGTALGAASAPPAAASAPAEPASPIPSIVRRYPVGTGAAMLAASQPPSSSAPAAPAAAAAPASPPAPSPAPATTAPSPGPAAPSSTPVAAAPAPVVSASAQPAAPAAPAQVAAIPPSSGPSVLPARVLFAPNLTDTPDQARATLDKVVAAMKADEQIQIQLVAYASGPPDQSSTARRVSLQRAISVRSYLMEHGVRSTRIDVRALGNRTDIPGPQDRVDIVAADR